MVYLNVLENDFVLKDEKTIKKSKFITYIAKINNKKELIFFINQYKDPKASHNCYAFRYGRDKLNYGYNNDGEPKGTAGEPLLKLIEINNLTNIIIFVIRYFGGIKLGTGRLQKAYNNSAIEIIKNNNIKELKILLYIKISFNISNIKTIKMYFKKIDAKDILYEFNNETVFFSGKINNIKQLDPIISKIKVLETEKNYF
ncbi:IMPACT family protein [Spiroplasma taiwanense]|uniref:Impact N-terminal domain-containing protein n=1 Tax=Spiroplasma taiwanense CT-1 TaxID=1276220 RepID=S5LYM2_9MOLU|nr:YigZ family protein [Spiroplasma taiwanense]AGR40757.1 hypothetical protein STAIW_v1c00620 [Spiroplasma taiwanense CT-1]